MKILCLFLPLVLLVAGCAHNRGGVVAGLATASALVVGIPFSPAAETLHAINQTGKNRKRKGNIGQASSSQSTANGLR